MKHNPRGSRLKDANSEITEDLTSVVIDAVENLDTCIFKYEYLQESFLDKFVSMDTAPSEVRRQRAINKWLATERNNEATNVRLLTVPKEYNILPRTTYEAFISTVRRFISEIIGEMPPWDTLYGGFSGGASTSRRRTESHPALKYLGKADVTTRALCYFSEVISGSALWSSFRDPQPDDGHLPLSWLEVVDGNVLFTVPKNHDIDRCACKEPDGNMYLQRGLGREIRASLRRKGVNLNDQSHNRALARRGSLTGEIATVDLSSASDSVSRELVFQLLPIHWFVALDSVRSLRTWIPLPNGDSFVHENEMFSSMGNGFTFELESLLFYCISRAVCYHRGISGIVSVYGDDIIVPSEATLDVLHVLSFLGFEPNKLKTFWTGAFRESCGGHYYNGSDVTPFYLRKPITNLLDVIHVANAVRKWSQLGEQTILDEVLEPLWIELASRVPVDLWGGHDLNFKGQLVSDKVPNRRPKRLIPLKNQKSTGPGGYLNWLDIKGNTRDVEIPERVIEALGTIETSVRVLDTHIYRKVNAVTHHVYGGPGALFLHELEGY